MTGRDLVSASLRLIGATAPGESLSASEATDGIAALNALIGTWSTEGLIVYKTTTESIALTPGDATYTMGTSGDVSVRPILIEQAWLRDSTGSQPIDRPVRLLSASEWVAISDKSLQTNYPHTLFDDGGYPQRTLSLYPVPTVAHTLMMLTRRPLTEIGLDDTLSLPPGYERALRFNLAIDLAPEYGRAVPVEVAAVAGTSKDAIRNANYRPSYLDCSDVPSGSTQPTFSIETGDFE